MASEKGSAKTYPFLLFIGVTSIITERVARFEINIYRDVIFCVAIYATTDEDRVDKVTKRKLRGRRLERTTKERESRVLKKLFVFISHLLK